MQKSINGIFEFLGVPYQLRTNGPYWIDNLLVTISASGVGGTVTNLSWGSQTDGRYDVVSVPWHGSLPSNPSYLPRSQEIRMLLRAESVTIYFERTVWRASKVSPTPATSSLIVLSIGRIAPGIIFGMSRLRINFCGVLPFVVSVLVIFLSFMSLVWVATNESLSGSLTASCSSKL